MGAGIHDTLGPAGYTPEMSASTYQAMADTCALLLRGGHAVVADAVFSKPAERAAIERVAEECGVPFDGLWLEAPPEVARKRIQYRKPNVSDATVAVLDKQLGYDLGDIAWARIDSGQPKSKTLADGLTYLFGGG
jgi:predicted kinase